MLCAALAVKNGMQEYDALAAITIAAARTVGIDSRVGSIARVKTLISFCMDRHPFDLFAKHAL